MLFNVGDLVSRNSYNNDTVFKIIEIDNGVAILKGMNIRLYADSYLEDLVKVDNAKIDDEDFLRRFNGLELNREEFFYLPGKVLHIDGDKEYLERCMSFYEKVNIKARGVKLKEDEVSLKISELLDEQLKNME